MINVLNIMKRRKIRKILNKLDKPIILKLFLLKCELFYLEKYINDCEKIMSPTEMPDHLYEEVLFLTDKYCRVKDKVNHLLGSEKETELVLNMLTSQMGEC